VIAKSGRDLTNNMKSPPGEPAGCLSYALTPSPPVCTENFIRVDAAPARKLAE
jgi:hypothetical protein